MSRDPRPPSIHVVKVEDGYADVLTSPICDFCGDEGPTWDYGCGDFHIDDLRSPFVPEAAWGSSGEWAVCDECARCIEHDIPEGLIIRQIRAGVPEMNATLIVAGFWVHKTGERTPFG